ncbi:MAG: DUF4127 family protein [Chloroflexota bacterium]
MTKMVGVIPLDDRMVNYEYMALLGKMADMTLLLPPKAWLGNPWRVGAMEKLRDWLREVARTADCLIVAIDTLGYGGLVNSRRSEDEVTAVLHRLQILHDLKAEYPNLTLLAYNILMRISRSNSSEEEKPYWRQHGAQLFRLSVLEDRVAMRVADGDEQAELVALRVELPSEIVTDYKNGRLRNHTINQTMIDWAAEGIFDYLIIPQDDTVDYGWNIAEARKLRQKVVQLGLNQRVSVYPGTDEIDMLLLARYVAQDADYRPTFWTRYSSVRHGQVITAFEDRPLEEVIKAHLEPLGAFLADDVREADILLYVNGPAEVQGNGPDQYAVLLSEEEIAAMPKVVQTAVSEYRQLSSIPNTLREMHTPQRNLVEFVRSLETAVWAGKSCAVVDVAYVNAGDKVLGDLLQQFVPLAQLAAYGGWNTAGNTLGTVLAQAVIRQVQKARGGTEAALVAHAEFLFLRFVEDILYMANLRSKVMLEVLPLLGIVPTLGKLGEAAAQVTEILRLQLVEMAAALAESHFVGQRIEGGGTAVVLQNLQITELWLSWGRLFDLSMTIESNIEKE